METVSAQWPAVSPGRGEGVRAGRLGHPSVKRSVKARDSIDAGWRYSYGVDGGQGSWLVQWSEARQSGEAGQDLAVDLHGAGETVAAVDDAVADRIDVC